MHLYTVLQEEDYPLYLKLGAPTAWIGVRGTSRAVQAYVLSREYLNHPSARLRCECEQAYQQIKGIQNFLKIGLMAAAGMGLLALLLYGIVKILG